MPLAVCALGDGATSSINQLPAEGEERCEEPMPLQHVEHMGRDVRIGAVVKRQRYVSHLLFRYIGWTSQLGALRTERVDIVESRIGCARARSWPPNYMGKPWAILTLFRCTLARSTCK